MCDHRYIGHDTEGVAGSRPYNQVTAPLYLLKLVATVEVVIMASMITILENIIDGVLVTQLLLPPVHG